MAAHDQVKSANMSGFGTLIFVLILFCSPRMCRTQPPSGAPVIMATKNLLAMTAATVKSANIDAARTQKKIEEVITNLQQNATIIQQRIDDVVNDTLVTFEDRIESLVTNRSDVDVRDCAVSSSLVKSAAAEILMDANSCVSNTLKSIERELNDTYFSIESILARINSDQNLAETCVAEYGKTEMALRHAIVTALCVSQAKERILSAIEDELSTRNDVAFLHLLYIDALNRITSCDDSNRISSFVADANFIHVKIMTCMSN